MGSLSNFLESHTEPGLVRTRRIYREGLANGNPRHPERSEGSAADWGTNWNARYILRVDQDDTG